MTADNLPPGKPLPPDGNPPADPAARRGVLITGCSSGLGRAAALALARRGWQVLGTVRRQQDRRELLDQWRAAAAADALLPDGLDLALCDITDEAQVRQLAEQARDTMPAFAALINNAGTAFAGPLELLPPSDLRAQLEVNVVAQMAVTQAVLPLLRGRGGTIINVSSVSGFLSFPVTGAYAASKHAVEALSDALRVELAPLGVRVVVVQPSAAVTSIWRTAHQRARLLQASRGDVGPYRPLIEAVERRLGQMESGGFAPETFARLVCRILEARRCRARYVVPRGLTPLAWLLRNLPAPIWDRFVRWHLGW